MNRYCNRASNGRQSARFAFEHCWKFPSKFDVISITHRGWAFTGARPVDPTTTNTGNAFGTVKMSVFR